jgi:hypothetical protein
MRKETKTPFVIGATALLALFAVACGSQPAPTAPPAQTTQTDAAAPTPAPTDGTAPAAAAPADGSAPAANQAAPAAPADAPPHN